MLIANSGMGPLWAKIDARAASMAADRAMDKARRQAWRAREAKLLLIRHRQAAAAKRCMKGHSEAFLTALAQRHGLTLAELLSRSRIRRISQARQEAAWRLRTEWKWSFPRIARRLGWDDHTTALHAVGAHAWRMGLLERPPKSMRRSALD